jgi:hypothetical protein
MTPRRPRGCAALAVACLLFVGGAFAPVPPLSAGEALAASEQAIRTRCSADYLASDWRFGPAQLPNRGVVALELRGYHRFGGLTPPRFVATYWDSTARGGAGGWRYPPDNGFVVGPSGQPEEAPLSLWPGEVVDRYGKSTGQFLAPFETPYAQRSIPPSSLDNDPPHSCDYHAYRVVRAFEVEAGPTAPYFDQPGWGTQFLLDGSLVSGAPTRLTVAWLVDSGFLVPLT